ncbi:MAG: restriction endonuclease subunit S [Promethearchaeota archaeon]
MNQTITQHLKKNKEAEWIKKKIGQCIKLIYGKGLTKKERKQGKIPVFGSNGIIGYHNKKLVKGPGIIVGRKGSVGKVTFSKKDFWPIDTTYYVKTNKDQDIKFWFYFLSSINMESMNSHSAVPGLNRNRVLEIVKEIPPFIEQQAIAKILSDLDAKIELNQRMNETLEAIGQALFKHWFIDFEFPDEHGNPYKSSGGEMVDSKLGEIPKGWEIDNLGKFIEFVKGKKPKTTSIEYIADYKPQILIAELDGADPLYAPVNGMTNVNKNEPIMVMDGASSGRIEIGFNGILGSTLAKIIACKEPLTNSYVFCYLKLKQDDINLNTTGTSIPHVDKEKIKNFLIVTPPKKIIFDFENIFMDFINRIVVNRKQISCLRKIRDLILPKLLSGKIRVPMESE